MKLHKCIYWMLCTILLPLYTACNTGNKEVKEANKETVVTTQDTWPYYLNSVRAHDERDTIVGKFNGVDIDTLYVVADDSECIEIDPETQEEHIVDFNNIKFFAKSSNPNIPPIEMFGYLGERPLLVFEGDLDGNGTDEWGYLHTWMSSQWRQYRVYTLKDNMWYHLIYDKLLDTPEVMRGSGYEILEPGPTPEWVKVNYILDFMNASEVCDTLLKPTFTPVTTDTP